MKIVLLKKLNAKIAISIAAAGATISIAFIKPALPEAASATTKKKVERPFRKIDIAYAEYTTDAASAAVFTYATGSEISIPANAFVDAKGKPVTGKVNIRYREFHDPVDFFISGIPMTYDSAGTSYHFESAGMLEILAFQNGKPVFVDPGKRIVVEMSSEQPEDKYNIYRFDSTAGNWKFIYKDRAKAVNAPLKAAVAGSMKTASPRPVTASLLKEKSEGMPALPVMSDDSRYHFNIDADLSEFPELAMYKDVEFEVKNGEKDFDPGYVNVSWNDVKIEKNNKGSFLMTLSYAQDSHTFGVQPVFKGEAYAEAYNTYEKLLAERLAEDKIKQKKNDSVFSTFEKERVEQGQLAANMSLCYMKQFREQEVIKRVFVIDGFGIWNSDCPACLPKGEQFAANYVDSTGKKLKFNTLYLVEKGRNAMFAITSYARLYYDPSKENLLWAITADNKIALLHADDFKKLKKKSDSCTVEMTVIDREITKLYEVKDIIRF